MLNRYILTVQGDKKDIKDLKISISQMDYNKVMHKSEFGHKYFFGMRKTWFPLILLEKYTISHGRKSADRLNAGTLFMSLLGDVECRSFYLDRAEGNSSTIKIYYRAKTDQREVIDGIMSIYNLKYNIESK